MEKEDSRVLAETTNYRLIRKRTEYPGGILIRGRGAELVSAKVSDLYVVEKVGKDSMGDVAYTPVGSYEVISDGPPEVSTTKVIREGLMSGETRAGDIFRALLESFKESY